MIFFFIIKKDINDKFNKNINNAILSPDNNMVMINKPVIKKKLIIRFFSIKLNKTYIEK